MIFVTIILLLHVLTLVNASTYQLSYSGILGPKFGIDWSSNESLAKSDEQSFVSESLAKIFSVDIGNNIILSGNVVVDSYSVLFERDSFCHQKKSLETSQDSISCDVVYDDESISMEIMLKVYDHGKVKLRVTVSALEGIASQMLRDSVPIINNIFNASDSAYKPVWEILPRKSSLEMQTVLNEKNPNETWATYSSVTDASSLDIVILSNPLVAYKELVSKYEDLEVWKYLEFGNTKVTTSLFIKSKLKYTTKLAGSAQAEAFVHPILISHPNPARVAVISRTPLAIGFEILKHKNVQEITVFDSNKIENDFVISSFPNLNDCSGMEDRQNSCMDSMDFVYENELSSDKHFDVIFLDVPTNSYEYGTYMSMSFMENILSMMEENNDSSVVINVGHAPSIFHLHSEEVEDDDHRGNLLRMVTRSEEVGGLGVESIHVYDEPNAMPLQSSFIMITMSASESKTYRRFFRRNPAVIDLDIAENMHPSPSSSLSYINTFQYDGPTHLNYLVPSRKWETWCCSKLPWKNMPMCTEFMTKFYDTKYHATTQVDYRIDPVKGRTLYAAEDIPMGHIILPRDASNSIHFDGEHYESFRRFIKDVPSATLFQSMFYTIDGYGFQVSGNGFGGHAVTTTINSFMNHGCNEKEINANPLLSLDVDEDGFENIYFSPLLTRRNELYTIQTFSLKDIKKGEEILYDYRYNYDDFTLRESDKRMCEGEQGAFNVDNEAILISL